MDKDSLQSKNFMIMLYVCYSTLADINMYQGWTAEVYRSTNKNKQIRVNIGYRADQNNIAGRSQ